MRVNPSGAKVRNQSYRSTADSPVETTIEGDNYRICETIASLADEDGSLLSPWWSDKTVTRSREEGGSPENISIKNWISRIVDQRSACSACFRNLTSALRELYTEGSSLAELLNEPGSILIGQDFKGIGLPAGKTGIGICTCGENQKCLKGCPPSKDAIKRFLKQSG
ncbi:MAG: hypothetical protein PQJ61_02965 [Spirochaetales bacterium]|uniref:Uncharacterized protein n=1 Tax=Candidatus Thalassospirochaeta sargassi TaxID=3119039 RepID=A0AAJ1MHW7_9SPIO|nr:hypothetical protein [Spirochaetales bacterium]